LRLTLWRNAYISSFGGYIKTASEKRNNTLLYYYLTLLYDNNTLCYIPAIKAAFPFLFLASMRLPSPSETAGSSGHERSPLEALPFTDGEIAGQRAGKRPQPTERPHSGLYPCGG